MHPTESVAKVKLACRAVFPDLAFKEEGDLLVGETATLDHFREMLRKQRIRDTAREVLIRGRQDGRTSFTLNKQAAYVGVVNFGALRAPLGDIHVTIEEEDLDGLIDRVAESTVGRRLTGSRGRSEGR